MHVLINELSFIGQASTIHEVSPLMRAMMEVMRALEPLRGNDPIFTHSNFSNCQLSPDCTVHKWARSMSASDRDIRLIFIKLATQGPFIDRILNQELDYIECLFNEQDVSTSSLAGAAYFTGTLVSLKNAPEFSFEQIQVKFSLDGKLFQDIEIINLTDASQVSKLRRRYVVSPKHVSRGWGTLMDIDEETAQKILDMGVMSGKQVYGYHNRKFYQFQPDNAGGYHGYPVSGNDIPAQVLKQLRALGAPL